MNIQIEFIAPPIGTDTHDWMAYDAAEDEEGRATGYGATQEAALTDLVEKIQMEAYAEGRKDESETMSTGEREEELIHTLLPPLPEAHPYVFMRSYSVGQLTAYTRAALAAQAPSPVAPTADKPVECPVCHGTKWVTEECEHCCGTGTVWPTADQVVQHPRLMGVK